MGRRWIVTALGKDRPGIVAGVTKVLYKLGCNLEDSAMTRLAGEFAIMLVCSCPAKITEAALTKAFAPLAKQLRLAIHLTALSGQQSTKPSRPSAAYLISVYGADRAGIVYSVAEALAGAGVNITDVETHRSAPAKGHSQKSLYLMLLEAEVPSRVSVEAVEQKIRRIGKRLGIEVSLRPAEADVL